ncbi:uncharacterized protein LOC121249240 [Juglans microcarpa x Juglans regia]|uniref:uncharacterized protein LOC121249240 n=1 Tax=Juglans microcarpa x Juglans regia TaxID=2249226 RepID=UPI001B7DDACB|nr:uncharacterized protein LOC121249240 [Juglans microcarpa x Juglans regia]
MSQSNHVVVRWLRIDQLILGWSNSSLLDAPLSQVINSESSQDAWEVLRTLYGSHTKDRIQQIRGEFQTLTIGTSSMEDYVHKAKSLALSLHGAGKPMDEDDFITCILRGLGFELDPIVAAINAHEVFPPLEGVIGKLKDLEMCIVSAHEASSAIALYTNHGNFNNHTRGFRNSCGRGSAPSQYHQQK